MRSEMSWESGMIILLDAGNTSVTCGKYHGGRMLVQKSLDHDTVPEYVINTHKSGRNNDTEVILSSVVPSFTSLLKKRLRSVRGLRLRIAGVDLPVHVKHKYKNQYKLGIDRLVNIYGALRIYHPPMLVIDFGTAIKADYISARGVFEGGMILPGPELSFQALLGRAARLPKKARLPRKAGPFLGRTTLSCMQSGIMQGYGAMTDGLIERFRARHGRELRVLLTGGFARHLKPVMTSRGTLVDPAHSMKSLLLLFKASQT